MALLAAASVLLGLTAPVAAINTDGRLPGSIPQLDVLEAPEYEDVDHPPFAPYPIDDPEQELLHGALLEQFDGAPNSVLNERWHVSSGEWRVEEPTTFRGFSNDQGLVLKSEQLGSAISRKTPQILRTSTGELPFVVQYEVKTQQVLRCGGAYVKLLPPTDDTNSAELVLTSDTPYVVMFGPDKCGASDKVHVILKDADGTEHHLTNPPRTHTGSLSTLYTLIIHPDQTFEVRRDGTVLRAGSLLDAEEFDPPLVPAREIADENDTKPSTWVEEEFMPDPEQLEKPADWDESQPSLISDPEAQIPEGWHEDWPLFVPDPGAKKPSLWDDAEDGEWVAPEILNPKCAALDRASGLEGCGEWTAPLIRNPAYRGKWQPPLIRNPEYQGPWSPRQIANPAFDLSKLHPNQLSSDIGGVGFELLTVQGNILFDNLYVGHSVVDAENIGNATWAPKYLIEAESQSRAADARRQQAEEMAAKAAPDATPFSWSGLLADYREEYAYFRMNPYQYARITYGDFLDLFRADKTIAVKSYPLTFVVFVLGITATTSIAFGLFNALLALLTGRQMPAANRRQRKRAPVPEVRVTPDTSSTTNANTAEAKVAPAS